MTGRFFLTFAGMALSVLSFPACEPEIQESNPEKGFHVGVVLLDISPSQSEIETDLIYMGAFVWATKRTRTRRGAPRLYLRPSVEPAP